MKSVTTANSMGTWQETVLVNPQARMLLKLVDAQLLKLLLLVLIVESDIKHNELTEEQSENLLSHHQLQHEQTLLNSTASSVTASEKDSGAAGPTIYINLLINGEPVPNPCFM